MSIAMAYCYPRYYVFDINVISREAASLVNKLGGYWWPLVGLRAYNPYLYKDLSLAAEILAYPSLLLLKA